MQRFLARERRQAKLIDQQQDLEQGVAGERELQQKKRKDGSGHLVLVRLGCKAADAIVGRPEKTFVAAKTGL